MTEDQIIKALKTCATLETCKGCVYANDVIDCRERLSKDVLHFINDLKIRLRKVQTQLDDLCIMTEVIQAEARKEFADRLKEQLEYLEYTANINRKTVPVETLLTQVNWILHEVTPETIDRLLKEMDGDSQ